MVSTNGSGVETEPETTRNETVKETRRRRRQEARIESHRQRSNNDALLNEFQSDAVEIEKRSVPFGARLTLYTVAGLLLAFILWANWARVDRIVTANGKLITTEPAVVIDTKLPSPIKSINARFGDKVSAGFVIATLDPTFSDADLKQLNSQKNALAAAIARLSAERDGIDFDLGTFSADHDWLMQNQVFLERKKEYVASLNKFEAENSKLVVQLENSKEEIDSGLMAYKKFREYEEVIKKLVRTGSKPKSDIMNRELQSEEAKMKYLSSKNRRRELLKSVETLRAERESFAASWRTETVSELVAVRENLASVEQELSKANKSNEFVELVVPDDLPYKEFVVLEVAEKSVGSIMQTGEPLFKLIPVGVPMEVEVEVEGKDVALIAKATSEEIAAGELPKGSDVRIKLSSFPYQKHGTLDGVVRTISEGSFEKQLPGGASSGVTTYKARVKILDPEQLERVPDNFRLMPGMTATAEIKVGNRKVIEYLLYPLFRYMNEAIREP